MKHAFYKPLGFLLLSLGAIGLFLPLLPSTPFVLLAANSFGHTMAYPHGHPHALTTTWADVLITGGVIAIMAFGADLAISN